MKYKVEYISTFYVDVLQAAHNLNEYPRKAKRIFAKIDKILSGLAKTPMIYPIYDSYPVFRKIVVEDYIVFYTVDTNIKCIEVHRLIYARMDIVRHLKGTTDNSD